MVRLLSEKTGIGDAVWKGALPMPESLVHNHLY